ncbi:MAG: EAL domain-containing protein, partial [Nitrospirota bacterium]|nr:EAL domain-containing protein [Nitrospirota bacterium]
RGIIQPMEFIPLAEETGLIAEIGEWVLWAACAWNRKLQDAGQGEFLMKVNFSTAQFHLQDIADLVRRVTLETGLDARYLDIEITESIATEEGSVRLLNKLSGMGVRISIDDFGTGYSSLAALKRLPINTIKIDRSFIGDISSDTNAKSIIRAIIAMAHNLNMKVLAEGVETGEQLEYLIEHGCDEAQGFFFSRAVAEEEFSGFLSKKTDKDPGKERI